MYKKKTSSKSVPRSLHNNIIIILCDLININL